MKSYKICLYIIPKTKMHGTLKTPLAAHVAQKIAQSV